MLSFGFIESIFAVLFSFVTVSQLIVMTANEMI